MRRHQTRDQHRQTVITTVTTWLNSHTADPPTQWQTCGLPISMSDIRQWFAGETTSRETVRRWYSGDPTRLDIDHIYQTWLAGKIRDDTITPIDNMKGTITV